MRGHDYAGVDWVLDVHGWCSTCTCGWKSAVFAIYGGPIPGPRQRHAQHVLAAEVERAGLHVDHYQRCQHCGQCGQPGDYCVCRDTEPCGCAHLHPMGSAYRDGALAAFVESDPDQGDLW